MKNKSLNQIQFLVTWVIAILAYSNLTFAQEEPRRADPSFSEDFSESLDDLSQGYGDFEYSADNQGAVEVIDGQLKIKSGESEGDQRLTITAEKLAGAQSLPNKVSVRCRLGCMENPNPVNWHMGVSIGNVKILLHPGYRGGGFRVENTNTHEYLLKNQDMGFTPAVGVMHEMNIRLIKISKGALLKISVSDGNSETVFQQNLRVSNDDLGAFDRIALERSGHQGGDALFDLIQIELPNTDNN